MAALNEVGIETLPWGDWTAAIWEGKAQGQDFEWYQQMVARANKIAGYENEDQNVRKRTDP